MDGQTDWQTNERTNRCIDQKTSCLSIIVGRWGIKKSKSHWTITENGTMKSCKWDVFMLIQCIKAYSYQKIITYHLILIEVLNSDLIILFLHVNYAKLSWLRSQVEYIVISMEIECINLSVCVCVHTSLPRYCLCWGSVCGKSNIPSSCSSTMSTGICRSALIFACRKKNSYLLTYNDQKMCCHYATLIWNLLC